jgi:RND family efflux transporter MFP subunit
MKTATGRNSEQLLVSTPPVHRYRKWSLLAATMAVLIMAGCRKSASEPEAIRPVYAIKVGDLKALQGREFPGRAKARHEVDLSFRVSGPLVSLPVDVGSQLKNGDVVAAIDPRDFQTALDSAQGNLSMARENLLAMERGSRPEEIEQLKASLVQAEANYRQALADHQRSEKLVPSGAASRSDFDATLARRDATAAQVTKAKEDLNIGLKGARKEDLEAKRAQIKALEAAADNAKNQLDYTVLKAPFAGSVVAKYVDNFQMVQAKQPIIRLLDISKIEVTVQVPESLIGLAPHVKKGICRFDALPGREFVARITKIGSEASQTTRTYPVTVAVDQPEDVRILPGMAATVRVEPPEGETGTGEHLIVPPSAVFTPENGQAGQQSYVWVVDEGSKTVARRAVRAGPLTPVGIAVLEGLQPGEWVVTAGVHSLREGQPVRISQEGS